MDRDSTVILDQNMKKPFFLLVLSRLLFFTFHIVYLSFPVFKEFYFLLLSVLTRYCSFRFRFKSLYPRIQDMLFTM